MIFRVRRTTPISSTRKRWEHDAGSFFESVRTAFVLLHAHFRKIKSSSLVVMPLFARDVRPLRRHHDVMAHTFTDVFVHCIFSTKDRRDVIPVEIQSNLWAYIHGIAKNLKVHTLAVGGTGNHSHVLLILPPTLNLSELVQKLKANSSRWIGEQGVNFTWQQGYAAFSVSPSMLDKVKSYIRNQPEHHRKRSFDEEFTAYLRAAGIETPLTAARE